jgi:four helix bundle protein
MDDNTMLNLKFRTKEFALKIVQLISDLPGTAEAQALGEQILRPGVAVGIQFREAQRAKTDADFMDNLENALHELAEIGYWLELLAESGIVSDDRLTPLRRETDELTEIFSDMDAGEGENSASTFSPVLHGQML